MADFSDPLEELLIGRVSHRPEKVAKRHQRMLYLHTQSLPEKIIAQKLGVKPNTVSYHLRNHCTCVLDGLAAI